MADELWYVGDVANVTAIVKDAASKTLVDPATIALTITKPSGGTETRVFTKDGTGEYHATLPVRFTEAGFWKFLLNTTGTYEGVKPVRVTVYDV